MMNGRIKRWAVVGLLLGIGDWAYAGEPPSFRETARITLSPRSEWEVEPMALTHNIWISVNGNFGDANSWTGGVPAPGDVIIFDGKRSQQSVTTGLDQSATASEQLLVKPSFHGNIGFAGNPLRVDLGAGVLVYRGRGQAFINTENGSFPKITVDVNGSITSNLPSLTLGGMGVGIAASFGILGVKRGEVQVLGDVNLTATIYNLGSAASLLLDTNLGGMTELLGLYATAGYCENKRTMQANKVIVVGAASKLIQVGALPATTHVIVIGNGKFAYNPMSAPGTQPTISVIGGVYDQSNEQYDSIWGTTVVGPDAYIHGGVLRGTEAWPPSLDFREEYPGAQE